MARAANQPLRVTHLLVENWRNFAHAEMNLPRRVFLVGPNASGKSNLLDVLRFLRNIVAIGGGFQDAVTRRGGVSKVRCLAARQFSDIAIQVQLGDDETPAHWTYEIRFAQDSQRNPVLKRERVLRGDQTLLDRPDDQDRSDPERLTQTYLEQVQTNQAFREIATFFASVRYLHIVPQLVREPDRSLGRSNDPFGGDFIEQIARTQPRTQQARLRRILKALQQVVPQLQALELERDEIKGTPHLRGKYAHWRPQGAWQTEESFSDGTLRLIGLLWALQDGVGPLLLEEPELSLHAEVVRYIPAMFARIQRQSGRQILVSTHSPEMLRDEGIGLDEILLLTPDTEGTRVQPASEITEACHLLEGGLSPAEIVIPQTRPPDAGQLALFGER